MSPQDQVLRDLAALHGRPDVSDQELRQVKRAVANEFLDQLIATPIEKPAAK